MHQVPVISLAAFNENRLAPSELEALAVAAEDHGFFLLSDHGADQLIADVFSVSAEFFAQPHEVKSQVRRDELNPLGYFDRELTKQKRDLKEVYDFKAGGYISSNPAKQTRWPATPTHLEETLRRFFVTFTELSDQTMRMVFTAPACRGQ